MIQQEEFDFSVGKSALSPVIKQEEQDEFDFSTGKSRQGREIPKELSIKEMLRQDIESQRKLWGGDLGIKIGGKSPLQHAQKFFKPVAKEAIGLGEGAVSAAGEYLAFLPSLIAGVGAKALGKSFEESVGVQGAVNRLLVHEPITEKGKMYTEIATSPLALFGRFLDKATEDDSAETAAAIRLGAGVVLLAAGSFLHGSVKSYIEKVAEKGKNWVRAKQLIKRSQDIPSEIKTVVEKIPDLPPELKPAPEQIAEQKAIHAEASKAFHEDLGQKFEELRSVKPTKPTSVKTESTLDKLNIEKNAGYNIRDEIKKSIQYLKGENPYKISKEKLTQKERTSLEPPTSPTLKKTPGEEPPMPEAGQIIYDALVEAKPLRGRQEAIFTAERGKKMAMGLEKTKELHGKTRAEAFRKAQAGKMKKLDFEPLKVPNEAIEDMYDKIWDSPAITEWERLSANSGLTKLLEGKIPQEGEIILLDRVFPKSLTEALKKKRGLWQKIKYGALEASGVPRALMASWDFSAPFRQGAFLAARYPKQFFNSFSKMFKMFGSEKAYQAVHESITKRETYPLMRQAELALTELDSILKLREEQFMSHWAEKIPGVRPSGRAYTGFLNLLRANVFDTLIKSAEKMGHNPKENAFLVKSIGNFVNVASGRGSLKSVLGVNLEKSAVVLNQVLFSPRLLSSRFKLLNPAFYIKLHPFVRRQALQSLLAFVGAGTTVLTLLKAAGADVETDPTSSRFGKATIGNTSIDIWGGFQQYIRTGAQLALGQTKSAITGKKREVKGIRLLPYPRIQKGEKGPFAPTSLNIAGRWLEYKQAPLLSFATDLLRGSTAFGEELEFGTTDLSKNPIAQRFIPMVMQDMMDIYKDNPDLLPVSAVGLFGVGLQTYEPRQSKRSGRR